MKPLPRHWLLGFALRMAERLAPESRACLVPVQVVVPEPLHRKEARAQHETLQRQWSYRLRDSVSTDNRSGSEARHLPAIHERSHLREPSMREECCPPRTRRVSASNWSVPAREMPDAPASGARDVSVPAFGRHVPAPAVQDAAVRPPRAEKAGIRWIAGGSHARPQQRYLQPMRARRALLHTAWCPESRQRGVSRRVCDQLTRCHRQRAGGRGGTSYRSRRCRQPALRRLCPEGKRS